MTQREYTWSSIFAWGLTLSGAVLATGGVIGMFWPQLDIGWLCIIAFAGMMAFGIGLVNCSAAGALQAALVACAPGPTLMSRDNVESMRVPNVASGILPGLAALGIAAASVESVMREVLSRRGVRSHLDTLRARR